jgi:type VI secretion system protein ImpL
MKKKAALAAIATFLAFVILAGILDVFLPLVGWDRVLVWAGLGLLGVVAATLIYLQLAPRAPKQAAQAIAPEVEVDMMIDAVRKRLSAAGVRGGRLDRLPAVILLGPTGSAKTSVVTRSALEAELLAGEAAVSEIPAATETLNLWYAQSSVLVEAGGRLLDDTARWERLLQRLKPSRLAAALGRGKQAPRAAVVCFSCADLIGTGGSDGVIAAAKKLRVRLAELSGKLGVRLPVYVIFTKADAIPYFEDYVRSLSNTEAKEVLGATLPIADVRPEAYAEFQAGRLRSAMETLFRSLALWRLPLLSREGGEEARNRAYEFPREVRKASDRASQFLLELCRPSQLTINPFLRGFYFTGVRPVVAGQGAEEARARTPQRRIELGATGVFSVQNLTGVPEAGRPTGAGGRRVPEWVFLKRILPELILHDEVASAVTAGGRRVETMRRAMLGVAVAFFLLLAGGFTVSYFANRSLVADSLAAVQAVEPLGATVDPIPTVDALTRMDTLRAVAARLGGFEREGRPWRLGWGLYTGSDLQPELRTAYFDRFARVLWSDAGADLAAALDSLPAAPEQTGDYATVYDALRAYLVTTEYPGESTPDFLTPVVLRHWRQAQALDPEREALARRQLDFYGAELPYGNPYSAVADETRVNGARDFLQLFTGTEPFYRALLTDAGQQAEPIQFDQLYPAAQIALRNPATVPAAFTRDGWVRVQETLDNLDALLTREDWVLGGRATAAPQDRARLAQELRTRYVEEYVGAWSDFLQAGSVAEFGGPADAARKLEVLSSNQSPLLQMLALASYHTAMDSLGVGRVFQPVHAVSPPERGDRLITEESQPYMGALESLRAAMNQVELAAGPARGAALTQAASVAEQAGAQIRQLAVGFSIEGGAQEVSGEVQRLLEAPVNSARGLVTRLPAAEVNASGPSFCAPIRDLASRYPFTPTAADEASLEDLLAILGAGESALWTFYDESLSSLISRQGNRFAARVGAEPQPNPAFVESFNRAAGISTALFPRAGEGPRVGFALRPQLSDALPEVRVEIDGESHVFTRTRPAGVTFTWRGSGAGGARILANVNGQEIVLASAPEGPWSVFRLMQQAEWVQGDGGRYLVRWSIPAGGGALAAEITFANGEPVFMPGHLRLDCVAQIVR